MRLRDWLVALLVAAGITAGSLAPPFTDLQGLSIDALFWLRAQLNGERPISVDSPVVVVAIDEETYQREPFRDTPRAMWTDQIAPVIDAVMDGGAVVLGMDVIFSTTVAGYIPGFDRRYLLSLRRHAAEGRIVLGKVQHQLKPISPFPAQSFAVGHNQNIRAGNLFTDADGIIRRVPIALSAARTDGAIEQEPSLPVELARRAAPGTLQFVADGTLRRDGRPVPGTGRNALLVNFEGDQRAIPTYSLADLHACAEAGDTDFFARHFAGKIVLLGTVLDVEDRKLTSMRFYTGPDNIAFAPRCRLEMIADLYSDEIMRDSIPGVYVQAFTVSNLLQGNLLREAGPVTRTAIILVLTLAAGALTMRLPSPAIGPALAGCVVLWVGAAVGALYLGMVAPLYQPPLAALIMAAIMSGYRFTVADREKRRLRQMFGFYVAPAVIDRMVRDGQTPRLGGETRELTVWFSDLVGFTSYAEGKRPQELVGALSCYLSAMTETIEEYGGFVDKYIGDAIVAVFGAPHDDPEHALHGVQAALACQARLDGVNRELGMLRGQALAHRIGVSTGPMLVGNVGSRRRLNYTVIGDTVNLAARLESANKHYGTAILVSEGVVGQCRNPIRFRHVDRVGVVGRSTPLDIYTPLGNGQADDAHYAEALAAYLEGRFDHAAERFAALADADMTAAIMLERCRWLCQHSADGWPGYFRLDTK